MVIRSYLIQPCFVNFWRLNFFWQVKYSWFMADTVHSQCKQSRREPQGQWGIPLCNSHTVIKISSLSKCNKTTKLHSPWNIGIISFIIGFFVWVPSKIFFDVLSAHYSLFTSIIFEQILLLQFRSEIEQTFDSVK